MMAESNKNVIPESTVDSAPVAPAPLTIIPAPAEVQMLKLGRRASKVLMTWTAALTAFFILASGIVDLFATTRPSLDGLPLPLADFGIFSFGIFFGIAVKARLDAIYAGTAVMKAVDAKKVKPATVPAAAPAKAA